jgi:hypothetical protein
MTPEYINSSTLPLRRGCTYAVASSGPAPALSEGRWNVRMAGAEVLKFCLHDDENFITPTLEQVCSYRIVVATLTTAAKLHNLGLPRGA